MEHLKNVYMVVMSAAASELNIDPASIGANAIIAKGSFQETERHIFAIIEDEEALRRDVHKQGITMGIDTIRPRQMTKELINKYSHLQTILDSLSEGVIEVHGGQIVYANPECLPAAD